MFYGSRKGNRIVNPNLHFVSSVRAGTQYAARHISKVFNPKGNGVFDGRVECNTHADTFVAGHNCSLLGFTERVCDVMLYADNYKPKKGIPIVKAGTGYTAANGSRFILVFNKALWMPDMEHSLMNPNQLCHFGIEVQDNLYHQDPMVI